MKQSFYSGNNHMQLSCQSPLREGSVPCVFSSLKYKRQSVCSSLLFMPLTAACWPASALGIGPCQSKGAGGVSLGGGGVQRECSAASSRVSESTKRPKCEVLFVLTAWLLRTEQPRRVSSHRRYDPVSTFPNLLISLSFHFSRRISWVITQKHHFAWGHGGSLTCPMF